MSRAVRPFVQSSRSPCPPPRPPPVRLERVAATSSQPSADAPELTEAGPGAQAEVSVIQRKSQKGGQPSADALEPMPGAQADAPMSAITRIKSQKALMRAALSSRDGDGDGDTGVGGAGGQYLRGAKGEAEDQDRLAKLDWVQELLATPGMQTLLTCGAMSKPVEPGAANGIDPDHLFMTLLRADLLRDLLFLWHPTQRVLHTCMSVGMDVCGHPSIVHGGFTSAMIDETTGGLVFELKKAGLLGQGQAFTVRLEVDYRRPMPASADVVCSARIERIEGRKIWTYAEVCDRPGGEPYATGRALYVTPKPKPPAEEQQHDGSGADGAEAAGAGAGAQ